MPITLAEAKVGMADKVDQQIVDMFRRSSLLLDRLTFDNAISPGTGGSTLVYGYTQLKTPSTAAVRAINSEYTANEAKREKKTTQAIIMGGAFEVDRVIQDTSGAIDELVFQADEKIKATANFFTHCVINGTAAGTAAPGKTTGTFDGLNKLLANSSTEYTATADLSTSENVTANYNQFLDELDEFISGLDGMPDMLLMNRKMLSKLRGIARRAGYYDVTKDDFGRGVETYNGIALMDAGEFYDGTKTVDIVADTAAGSGTFGTSDIYAVKFGLDAFHGISPTGTKVITSYMPDLTQPGAVKKGEVELVAGVALKNTLKAGHMKGIITAPKTA
nr:MAG TPA: major capsid protein [Caudoviricetes sp.]DAV00918.1 MAG TPA: major capsid protein [Caudoviricetes sp.]